MRRPPGVSEDETVEVLEVEAAVVTDPRQRSPRRFASPPVSIDVVIEGADLAGLMRGDREHPVRYLSDRCLAAARARPGRILRWPSQVHDAKPAMRLFELGIDLDGVDLRHRARRLRRQSGRPSVRPGGPWRQVPGTRGRARRRGDRTTSASAQGALRLRRSGPDLEAAARRAWRSSAWRNSSPASWTTGTSGTLFDEIETAAHPRAGRAWSQAGIAIDRAYLEGLGEDLRDELANLETTIHEAAGGAVQRQLDAPAAERCSSTVSDLPVLKKTSKGVPSTDASVLAKLEGEHPIVASLLRYPRAREAAINLRGRSAAAHRGRRPHPHHLQSDGRRHRAAVLRQPEPAEHPGSLRDRAAPVRQAFVPERRLDVRGRRLLPDRAAHPRPPERGLRAAAMLSEARRDIHTATAASVFGVPTRRGDSRDAAPRQGHQLRPALRDGGLRSGRAPRDQPGGGPGAHRRLLRARFPT